MEHQQPNSVITPDRPFRIHPAVWLIAGGIIAALVAIFVFKVAISTVITYGFIGLMLISHIFMHGGHGSHGSQGGHDHAPVNKGGEVDERQSNDEHAGHSGGCH